jgi:2-haloacid dehalogenase
MGVILRRGTILVVTILMLMLPSALLRAQGRVTAVLFDSYGTLVSWEGVESALTETFRRQGVTTDPAAFLELWRSKQLTYILYNTLVDKGFEPFSFVTRRALHTAARFHDVELTKPEEDELIQVWHELDPYPDVIEGLKAIRALGYPIMGPLSNGDSEMVRVGIVDRFIEMGFEFDTYLTADLWGKNKVHPDIYLKSVAKLGLEVDEVVFVCRGQFDIVGAKAAGLKVIWVNRADEPLEDHGYVPDWEVRDFFEVAELLEREQI